MTRGERRRARPTRGATTAALALALVAGCGDGGQSPSAAPNPSPSAGDPSASADPGDAGPAPSPAVDPADSPELAKFYDQDAEWVACGSGFQCTKVTVPLDYDDPTGTRVKLSLLRLRATNEGKRIGTLFINPGGPGGSGVEYAQDARERFSEAVRARYDIVGFDPRGVGTSDPIDCLSDKALDKNIEADASPDSEEEIEYLEKEAKAFADGCEKRSGKYLPHLGTADVARDLDVMRAVLGDEKLHFLGKSYGTFIGAVYAEQFPSRVGRLVLDGAIDPSLSSEEQTRVQAAGFEQAFSAYIKGCLDLRKCPLGDSEEQIRKRVGDLLDRIDSDPLPTEQGRELNEALGVLGIFVAMYAKSLWEPLNLSLTVALTAGDGSGLLRLADIYTDRQEDGTYKDNANEVIYAVNCLDRPGNDTREGIEAALPALREASPLFGEYIGWGSLPCGYWPVKSEEKPHPIAAAGAAPIVVVGTTRDPATPYEWAQALADQLESGVLLTYAGDGHTAYLRGSKCVDSAIDKYLLEGKPPSDGKRC